MENLNAEQVKKALENWVKNYDGKVLDFVTLCNSLALINSQEQRIKELTEEVERSETAGGCKESVDNGFSPSVTELQRENERLRAENQALRTDIMLKKENDDFKLGLLVKIREDTKADTVRKMQSEIKERCIKGGIYPALVAKIIDNVAEELISESQGT